MAPHRKLATLDADGYVTDAQVDPAGGAGVYQPLDADLTALAGLTSAADKLPYFTGSGAAAVTPFTAAGRAIVDDADAAAQRTTLGLGTAATQATGAFDAAGAAAAAQAASQPLDATLTGLAAVTVAAGNIPYGSGADAFSLLNSTAYGRGLLNNADAAAMRTSYGSVIGTNVQAWDADLDSLAAVGLTAAGLALLDDADAAAQRTTLGLGTAAVAATGDFRGATADHTHASSGAQAGTVAYSAITGTPAAGQPLDSDLTAIAALSTTAFGRALLALADPADSAKFLNGAGAFAVPPGSERVAASTTPAAVGTTGAVGVGTTDARADHVHAHEVAHIAHDTIWDAAGDLAVGSGADTAAKLSAGAAGAVLAMGNSAVIWNAGTSFPGSKATNDRYWRTDLGMEFYYDGTRWLSAQLFADHITPNEAAQPWAASNAFRWGGWTGHAGVTDLWIVGFDTTYFVASGATALGAAHKWVTTYAGMLLGTFTGTSNTVASGASAVWRTETVAVGALLGAEGGLSFTATKTGTPGTFRQLTRISYRLVAT